MKQPEPFKAIVKTICDADPRYAPGAYVFMREALNYKIEQLHKTHGTSQNQHIGAYELLSGVREYALNQYGPIAYLVLTEWGLKDSQDIGHIVFNLIKYKVFSKSDNDQLSDFGSWISFEQAFLKIFEPALNPILPRKHSKKASERP